LSPLACSDPRDKIFALLGLAKDAEQWSSPDYSKSPESIYKDFVKFSITASGSLDIIVRRWAPSDAARSTPSWICIADESSFDFPLQFVNADAHFISDKSMGSRRYNASGNWKPENWWEIRDDTNTLHVKGFRVDVVGSVTSTALTERLPDDWLDFGLESSYSTPDAFWRTLLADSDPIGIASPPADYKDLLESILSPPGFSISAPPGDRAKDIAVRGYSSIPNFLLQHMQAVIWKRALARTQSRHLLALVPANAMPGDCKNPKRPESTLADCSISSHLYFVRL